MSRGADVAQREIAAVVLEGAYRERDHRRQQENRYVQPEGDHAQGPAQPTQQVRCGQSGRRPGSRRGARPGDPGILNGSRGLDGLVHR